VIAGTVRLTGRLRSADDQTDALASEEEVRHMAAIWVRDESERLTDREVLPIDAGQRRVILL
jgi:hypothetical protein